MHVAVLSGSPRRKDGYRVIKEIESFMRDRVEVTTDYIQLSDKVIKPCIGCMLCFHRGEDQCPLKDDVSEIRQRLLCADAIVLLSPVYAMHVTGIMKTTIDRLSYMFHRPELIGKPMINIVTTSGGGIKETLSYLKMVVVGWGGYELEQIGIVSPRYFEDSDYYDNKYALKTRSNLERIATKLIQAVEDKVLPIPTMYQVFTFRGLKSKTLMHVADYDYWEERGWLESDYFYKTKLGPLKRLMGRILDRQIQSYFKKHYQKIHSKV